MRELANNVALPLPEIPRKRYFAIGEVSELCAVKPHVLRYWEQEFPQLKPVKRRGNRRYYQHDDVQMIRRIRSLLYEQGFTIGGARQRLREMPKPASLTRVSVPASAVPTAAVATTKGKFTKSELKQMRSELEAALKLLDR
jgi:DNA-binding transcriptional MerR regulator